MEQMHADIGAMRSALQLQVNVCADLRAITMDVNRRVCSLEFAADVAQHGGRDMCRSGVAGVNRAGLAVTGLPMPLRLNTERMNIKVVSYNCRGLRAEDRARRVVIDQLLDQCDVLCLQETFLTKQDLNGLNAINDNFMGRVSPVWILVME